MDNVRPTTPSRTAPRRQHGPGGRLARRRTIRDLAPHPLTDAEIGQLLWAAQGVTHDEIRRTAPSASSLFPLEVYVATAAGLAHYLPAQHALEQLSNVDLRPALQAATGDQPFVGTAPLIVVISAVADRLQAATDRSALSGMPHSRPGTPARTCSCRRWRWTSARCRSAPSGRRGQPPAGLPRTRQPLYLFAVGRLA